MTWLKNKLRNWLINFLEPVATKVPDTDEIGFSGAYDSAPTSFYTEQDRLRRRQILDAAQQQVFQRTVFDEKIVPKAPMGPNGLILNRPAMDGIEALVATGISDEMGLSDADELYFKNMYFLRYAGMSEIQLGWFASQSFLGYQMLAMIAQHWLVDKACTMPAEDAMRQGFDITVNDGTQIDTEVLKNIQSTNAHYKLEKHLVEFVRKGRTFGIRHALFKVDSDDPEYYLKPFNFDGVKPGSYKGIVQIDPYWITPELDMLTASDPLSLNFYTPTYWRVGARRIHHTHFVIMTTGEVADILKPTYYYGGVSLPQKIYQRIYASERTADEGPKLALTKRLNVQYINLEEATANPIEFQKKAEAEANLCDNYGTKYAGLDDRVERHDTSLADLDAVIMTQYQLVAAIANVPAVKLLGTSPKGFNATGEFEESSYHEELQNIQKNDYSPFLLRHYGLVIRSEVAPKFKIKPFSFDVTWGTLDTMTAEEQANVNKIKAETDKTLIEAGVISQEDSRKRIINDPDSGYSGLEDFDEMVEDFEDDAGP